jgi:hypothetical protein
MVKGLSDRTRVVFDDERVLVNAGVVLAVTLARRLGIEALIDRTVPLGGRPGASRPGRKVLSLVFAMVLGADCIDDCGVLRAGRTEAVLGIRAMAPSTLGTFLRSFTFGHVRQLDRVLAQAIKRAWAAGAGPNTTRRTQRHARRPAAPNARQPNRRTGRTRSAHAPATASTGPTPQKTSVTPHPRPKRWIEV